MPDHGVGHSYTKSDSCEGAVRYWDNLLPDTVRPAGQFSSIEYPADQIEVPSGLNAGLKAGSTDAKVDSSKKTASSLFPAIALPLVFAGFGLEQVNSNLHLAAAMAAGELGTVCSVPGKKLELLGEAGKSALAVIDPDEPAGLGECLNGSAGFEIIFDPNETALRKRVLKIKETAGDWQPLMVRLPAMHEVAAAAEMAVRAGADAVLIDAYGDLNGSGALGSGCRSGLPIEVAVALVDERLQREGLRSKVVLIVSGGIRSGADAAKAVMLGADAVDIGPVARIAVGCTLCGQCRSGQCAWGIATEDVRLSRRQHPELAAEKMIGLARAWLADMKELIYRAGGDSIAGVRGNRRLLRALGLSETEMDILGVSRVGE
ncbi:glutamate synthase-related protein [Maridesulfovibrio sp.]|uniref:glutamate synthase-related protein n=1 Tax=Maridesulfovibrio sp. TaxID=2795000 RepID=UPI002A187851|nr:glutamate synthase-related protein [Maridesulfovibrio sp.]